MKKIDWVPKILCAAGEETPKRSTVTAAASDQAQASQGKTPKGPPRVCTNKTKTRPFFKAFVEGINDSRKILYKNLWFGFYMCMCVVHWSSDLFKGR